MFVCSLILTFLQKSLFIEVIVIIIFDHRFSWLWDGHPKHFALFFIDGSLDLCAHMCDIDTSRNDGCIREKKKKNEKFKYESISSTLKAPPKTLTRNILPIVGLQLKCMFVHLFGRLRRCLVVAIARIFDFFNLFGRLETEQQHNWINLKAFQAFNGRNANVQNAMSILQ